MNETVSGRDGSFTLGLAASGIYDFVASHPEFSPLPALVHIPVESDMQGVPFYLPPKPDLIENGDFESLDDWHTEGIVPPAIVEGMGHTGHYALQLGELAAAQVPLGSTSPDGQSNTDTENTVETIEILSNTVTSASLAPQGLAGDAPGSTWAISQSISVPIDLRKPTLAWIHRVDGDATPEDILSVAVRGPASVITQSLSLEHEEWVHDWMDVSDFAGQEIEIRFSLVRKSTSTPLTVWLDEVRLGPVPIHYRFLPVAFNSH
jgi:hypothetical protein